MYTCLSFPSTVLTVTEGISLYLFISQFKGAETCPLNHLPPPCSSQQGLGAVEALTDPRHEHLDQLLSLEKRLLQALGDPEETSPFTQVASPFSQVTPPFT